MELRVLRASGGRCAASIYRGAWSAARTYRMEPAWVAAMIETESSCRPEARSRAGAWPRAMGPPSSRLTVPLVGP